MRYRGDCMQLAPSVDSALGVRLVAFLIFLRHILQNYLWFVLLFLSFFNCLYCLACFVDVVFSYSVC